jgi:GPH family glycoside/pentoside/hexuronide:cation symporter
MTGRKDAALIFAETVDIGGVVFYSLENLEVESVPGKGFRAMKNQIETVLPDHLSLRQVLAYSAGELAATYLPMALTSWLMYFYYQTDENGNVVAPLMTLAAFSIVQFVGKISDSLANPLVGYLSDRTQSRWGRRIPYIIFGAPLMALTTALIWFPPDDHPSMANNLWLLANLVIFWASYTFVVAPYLALMPEIARSNEERIKVGGYMAGGDILGFLISGGVIGILISVLKGKVNLGPVNDPYKLLFIVSAIAVLILFYLTWWFIKETPHSEAKEVKMGFFESISETLKNPTFPYWVLTITLLNPIRGVIFGVMPFFTKSVLKLGDSAELWAGFFQMGILVGAGVCLPLINWAGNKYGKKRVFMYGVLSFAVIMPVNVAIAFLPLEPGALKFVSLAGFALLGPGAASMLTLWRPIISDTIDFDEKLTGYRREAIYMGVEGLIGKLGDGMAPIVIAISFALFAGAGGNLTNGVLAAMILDSFLVIVTCLIFRKYPIVK